jgi:hypothetical protein
MALIHHCTRAHIFTGWTLLIYFLCGVPCAESPFRNIPDRNNHSRTIMQRPQCVISGSYVLSVLRTNCISFRIWSIFYPSTAPFHTLCSTKDSTKDRVQLQAVDYSQYGATTLATESLRAPFHSQCKLTTPRHENRKILHENELLKAKEPTPHV